MKSFIGLVLTGLLVMNSQLRAESTTIVATSIKPVSMIVKAIGGDKVEIKQIVSNSASPHDFALRPSDLKKILNADLVVWVGESLEPFLEKPIANSQHAKTAIEWMTLVSTEEHGVEEAERHDGEKEKDQHDLGHHHEGLDPHVWLDLNNALILANSITVKLSRVKPEEKAYFQANLLSFKRSLDLVDKENRKRLSNLKEVNYVVFHDAYGYFEAHYGLDHIANISLSPERKPGAKKIVTIRRLMKEEGVACIFSEVQFNPAIVNALVEGTKVKSIELDPLGSRIKMDKEAYPAFLSQMSNQFSHCQN